jgi:hypothetical protein
MPIIATLKLARDEAPSANYPSIEQSSMALKGKNAVVINSGSIVAGIAFGTGQLLAVSRQARRLKVRIRCLLEDTD